MVEGPQLDYGIYLLTILLAPFIIRYHCCWLRCPGRPLASLRLALAPAYLAPGVVREGVDGGGFVREGVAEVLGSVGMVTATDRCSAVLHFTGVPVVAVLAAVWGGGGAQTAVGIKMHMVPYLRRDEPVRRQGCTHLIVLMKYRGL